jgi:transposase
MSKFVDCARDQAFLLPPDLRDWVPEDDLAHFVIEAVERVAIGAFEVDERGTGSAQYQPRMMLALLIYCYANGIFSSRRIERATHRDIGVRLVAANQHPDHDTIATFRRRNFRAVAESFLQVLLLAKELRLLKVGIVSVDGSKVDANASKHRSVTYRRAGELVEQLRLEIADLMARAEQADGSGEDDPQALAPGAGPRRCPRRSGASRPCVPSWTPRGSDWRRRPRRAPRPSGPPSRPRWRRARSARGEPRASTPSRRTTRRGMTSRAICPTRTAA